MIDTVVLRVHDLQRHLSLVEWLDRQHKQTDTQAKTIRMERFTDQDEFTVQQKILHRTSILYHDSGEIHEVAHFNQLKSSHYLIAYKIDYKRQFVEFNLSVPKYVFGTNIYHFNTPPTSRRYVNVEHSTIEKNLEEAHARLVAFLDHFFAHEFGAIGADIDRYLVEINRLDICFNQVFAKKEDALDYFAQLVKLKRKGARQGTNYSRNWRTTIMYKTQRFSMKVYHKGTEFAKNDAKQLRQLNERGANFDVQHYQDFADGMLRYEMTFRSSYMSYLYLNKIFRKRCHIWQHAKKLFKQWRNHQDKPGFIQWRKTLSVDDVRHIDYYRNRITKSKDFYLRVDRDTLAYDQQTDEYEFNRVASQDQYWTYPALFSARLVRLMGRRFLKELKEFELNVKKDSRTVLASLEKHNSEVKQARAVRRMHGHNDVGDTGRKISVSKIRALTKLLETHTFEEIEAANLFERRTWYNLRQDLAMLGVTQQSLGGLSTSSAMDLHAYNGHVLYYSDKLRNTYLH